LVRIVVVACRVRTWLVLIGLTGCSLYFGDDPSSSGGGGDHTGNVYPPPPPQDGLFTLMRCEDGDLRAVHVGDSTENQPGHGAGHSVGSCTGACRSAAYICPDLDCSGAENVLCETPPSTGTTCSLEGTSCSGSATIECPATTSCGTSVPGSSCACSGGVYACTPHGITSATIQQQIVGKWQGTVHPPSSADYEISLWIYPDGTYWAECDAPSCVAFYYGGDGPYPDRWISILAASSTEGAWANIGIYFGSVTGPPSMGAIESLTVSETSLRFAFNAAWMTCDQPFFFDLTRVQ
jgi:hypothetical protein